MREGGVGGKAGGGQRCSRWAECLSHMMEAMTVGHASVVRRANEEDQARGGDKECQGGGR